MNSLKIGIFGGSFNPIHTGHLNILDNFINKLNLNYVILIPNKLSPFKSNQIETFNYNFRLNKNDILELLKLNTQNFNNITILDYELNSNEINYSIDTFEYLKVNIANLIQVNQNENEVTNIEYYFLIGDDNLITFHLWKRWEDLINNVNLVVGLRNYNKADIEFFVDTKLKKYRHKILLLNNSLIHLSSTEVRKSILEYQNNLNNIENKNKLIENLGIITYNYLIDNNIIKSKS